MVGIYDPACDLLPPHGRRNYTCVLLPLYSTFSLTSSPLPPSQTKCTVYTDSLCLLGGVGVLNCNVDHILQEFSTLFLTRFRTYKIASPPQTKMTRKDDIKGLVSLKFLRPYLTLSHQITLQCLPLSTEELCAYNPFKIALQRRHTFRDRRPCTTVCPGCWAMGTHKLKKVTGEEKKYFVQG